jgi:multidrug efflux pump subunit AcrA (membrane-fusion protein)
MPTDAPSAGGASAGGASAADARVTPKDLLVLTENPYSYLTRHNLQRETGLVHRLQTTLLKRDNETVKLRTTLLKMEDENVTLNDENARLNASLHQTRAELRRLRGQNALELDEAPRAELRAELEQALLRVESAELRSEAEEAVARAMPDGVCPMTLSLMRQPVVLADGNSYEKSFVDDWLLRESARDDRRPPQSPLTNTPLAHLYITENHMLRKLIIEAVDQAVLELRRRKQAPAAPSIRAKRRRE